MAKQIPAASQPPQPSRTVQLPPMSFRADLGPQSIDDASRTVELIFTTGAAVQRMDYWTGEKYVEVLSLDPAHVRLDRLNEGAPLLDSHSAYSVADQLGAVVPGSATLFKKAGTVKVRFSKRDAVEPIWQDVKDGLIRSVSVGYRIHRFEETVGKDNKIPVRTATDWEPFEVSMVPIPADPGAKTRGGEPTDANPCEIVTREAQPSGLTVTVKVDATEALAQIAAVTRAVEATQEQPPTTQGAQKESKMIDKDRSETIVEQSLLLPDPPAKKLPVEPNERDAGGLQERARVQGIRRACMAVRLPRSFEDGLIEEGCSLVDAQSRVFDEVAKRGGDDRGPGRIPDGGGPVLVGDDPLVHARAGIANALLHRVAAERHKLDDIGRPYRGMSVMDIGKALLSSRGVRITKMTRSEIVDAMMGRGGMHTTADFPSLLEDVAHKNLRSAYEAAPQTWLTLAKPVNLSDFKPSRQLQVGDAPSLDEVLEHGEFTSGTITEAKEQVQLKTYGKKFAITRQALINDDLNAFGEVPAAFGRKAREKESDLAWAQITSNPTMGDGAVLFIAAHGNLSPFGQDLTIGHLGDARTAMRLQKGIDGVTPLNLTPRYLIVPATLETVADQIVTAITPATVGTVNPFGPNGRTPLTVIVEARLDANSPKAWYVACSIDQAPVLYYGTLDGQSGPDLRQQEGFDIDGIQFRCRLDVAMKAADWRAIYKDPGA
jgi:phage major head subunit gpT-like protein